MMRTTFVVGALLCSAAVASPSLAQAPPASSTSKPLPEEWAKKHEQAMAHLKAGRFDEAIPLLREFYEVRGGHNNLWNLANAEADGHHYVAALQHFRKYLSELPPGDPETEDVKQRIEKAYKATGHIRIQAREAVKVRVDDKPVAAEARGEPVDVEPGKHVVDGALGDQKQRVEVDAPAGAEVVARFDLAPVGGNLIKIDPDPTKPPPPGFWSTRNTLAVILGAGALASFGVGGGFGLSASSKKSRYEELGSAIGPRGCPAHPSCVELKDTADSQNSAVTLSNVFLITGGVLTLATAGVLIFVKDSAKEENAKQDKTVVAPAVSPSGVGFHLIRTF